MSTNAVTVYTRYQAGTLFAAGYVKAYGLRALLRGLAVIERSKDAEYAAGVIDVALREVQS